MKRFFAVLVVAAVAGATYVATAPGGQRTGPTPKQFTLLAKQVASLKTLVRTQGGELKTLKTELTTLQGQLGTQGTTLTTVQSQLATVQTTANDNAAFITNCLKAKGMLPVSRYQDYVYSDGVYLYWPATALDVDTSSTPGVYLQLVVPGCESVVTTAGMQKTASSLERQPFSFEVIGR